MIHTFQRSHAQPGVLPPHILTSMSRNGTRGQRSVALKTLASYTTFRSLRSAAQVKAPATKERRYIVTAPEVCPRAIADAGFDEIMAGPVVRTEGMPRTGDDAVDEAYIGLGATDHLFWDAFDRDSIDNDGMTLEATVHFGRDYNDAFWNGHRMVFGDGDGDLFNRFTLAIEVTGHELSHGVIEHEGGLHYFHQSGALNESIADVFGSLVKQRAMCQTVDQADWLIGAGLFTDKVNGVAFRSMKAPGTAYDDPVLGRDPQPAHMDDYVATYDDNGGVHINSGIPNRAFYLLAMELGGHAWERAGRIWYDALRDAGMHPHIMFESFAALTLEVAERLYGDNSEESRAVVGAWNEVGVPIHGTGSGPIPSSGPGPLAARYQSVAQDLSFG